MATNYPENGRSDNPKSHTLRSKALLESENGKATNYRKNRKNNSQLNTPNPQSLYT
jgi:hypothetical protein